MFHIPASPFTTGSTYIPKKCPNRNRLPRQLTIYKYQLPCKPTWLQVPTKTIFQQNYGKLNARRAPTLTSEGAPVRCATMLYDDIWVYLNLCIMGGQPWILGICLLFLVVSLLLNLVYR